MKDKFLPFARPTITEEAIADVVDCLRSGWITTGPRTERFAAALQQYLNAKHVLPLTSGTAGLHLSLLGLDLQPGDEVITTPMTFAATVNTIVLAGGTPVFVDVDRHTYNMNVELLERAITARTRAIMPVHFAGLPVDLDPLYKIAKKHNLHVIEDAAHAIGAEYQGKKIGSFGDTQVFSFHPTKNITTIEGGCVTTSSDKLAQNIALRRFHGMDREAWDRYSKKGKQDYEIIMPGLKYNMSDVQAAIGIHQLAQLETFIKRRTEISQTYYDEMHSWDIWSLPQKPSYAHRHAWHIFTPLLNDKAAKMTRHDFMTAMKENNIGTGLHYQAVHLYPYYRDKFGFKKGDFPNAEYISDHIVSLPLFPAMTEQDQEHAIMAMKKIFKL